MGMFQFIVWLVMVVSATPRAIILETTTGLVLQRQWFFLTKMHIRSEGSAEFFMGEVHEGRGMTDPLSPKEENSMWLVVIPR